MPYSNDQEFLPGDFTNILWVSRKLVKWRWFPCAGWTRTDVTSLGMGMQKVPCLLNPLTGRAEHKLLIIILMSLRNLNWRSHKLQWQSPTMTFVQQLTSTIVSAKMTKSLSAGSAPKYGTSVSDLLSMDPSLLTLWIYMRPWLEKVVTRIQTGDTAISLSSWLTTMLTK